MAPQNPTPSGAWSRDDHREACLGRRLWGPRQSRAGPRRGGVEREPQRVFLRRRFIRNAAPSFGCTDIVAGGMGGRPGKDGIDLIDTDVTNSMNIPVEGVRGALSHADREDAVQG